MSQGVMVVRTTGINAQIQRNAIINYVMNPMEAIDNHLGKDESEMIIVKANKIAPAIEGLPVPSPQTPNGIMVG
jgi:hypothetical protein